MNITVTTFDKLTCLAIGKLCGFGQYSEQEDKEAILCYLPDEAFGTTLPVVAFDNGFEVAIGEGSQQEKWSIPAAFVKSIQPQKPISEGDKCLFITNDIPAEQSRMVVEVTTIQQPGVAGVVVKSVIDDATQNGTYMGLERTGDEFFVSMNLLHTM